MSNRSIGDKFEQEISNLLEIPVTVKSGGHWDNADMDSGKVLIECKLTNKAGFSGTVDHIKKLKIQADKALKEWVYIRRTPDETYVIVSLDYFSELTNNGKTLRKI